MKEEKWVKSAAWGFGPKTAAQVRESARERYQDELERHCGDDPPTEEDHKAVRRKLGSSFLFGAGFLRERHWTMNPAFAQAFSHYERSLGYVCLFLGMVASVFVLEWPSNSWGRAIFGFLLMSICVWSALNIISALLLRSSKASNADLLCSPFSAAEFVPANNGINLESKGFLYTFFKGIVALVPLIALYVNVPTQGYLFAAMAVVFLAVVAAERTVRMIFQRRRTTYLTRIGVDLFVVLVATVVWFVYDKVAEFGFLQYLLRWKGSDFVGVVVVMLGAFYLYMLCDILVALRRIYQCHQHTLKKTHPAITKYLKYCSPYTPKHVVEAVQERIQDALMERGADPMYPDDETLIDVFKELGSPDEVFVEYASRGLVSRDFATLCIMYNSLWVHLIALVIAAAACIWYGSAGNVAFSDLLTVALMSWFSAVSLIQYASIAFFRELSACLRIWKN